MCKISGVFYRLKRPKKLPLRAVRRAANLIWHSCRWQLYHKKWSWLASARLRRGVFRESSWKLRTAFASNAPLPPPLAQRSPFPKGEGFSSRPGVCRGGFLCSRLFSNTSDLPFSTPPVSSKNVNCASLTKKCQANAAISRKFGDVFTKMLNSAIVFMSQEQENILFS